MEDLQQEPSILIEEDSRMEEEPVQKPVKQRSPQESYNKHEQQRLPVRSTPPPSPPPFAHYIPRNENGEIITAPPQPMTSTPKQEPQIEERNEAGCCKCTVM